MTLAEQLRRLLLCDPAMKIAESPQFTDEPKIGVYSARTSDGRAVGHGIDMRRESARLKAAAEALERSCLAMPPSDETTCRKSFCKFGDAADQVDPAEFGIDDIERARATPRLWVRATRCADSAAALLPAETVYLGLAGRTDAPIRRESISTGAALGLAGAGDALRRGLFEVIERDAFMAAWLAARTPCRIVGPFGDLDGLFGDLARYRLETRVFDLGRELGPPAALAITIDRSGAGPAVTAGIAARETYRDAIRSALLESVGCRRGIRFKMARGKWPEAQRRELIDSIETRAAFWTPPSSLALLPDWVFGGGARPYAALEHLRCDGAQALAALAAREIPAYHCDLTTPALAANGFEVVRFVVPRLHPLHIAERATVRTSWRGELSPPAELPPHPFI